MNQRQVMIRLQTLIQKDKQRIGGYGSVSYRMSTSKYNALIMRYEGSIKRKREAIDYVLRNPDMEFNWKGLCSQFEIRRR